MNELQHARIFNRLCDYNRRAAKRKGYSPYAMAHYCKALTNTQQHCDNGADLRVALLNCFCGRLLNHCLKVVGLETSTREEQRFSIYPKLPELPDEE